MSKLESYLAARSESLGSFGRRLQIPRSAQTVLRWARGERLPCRVDMLSIYLASDGAVGPADFFDLPVLPEMPTSDSEAA